MYPRRSAETALGAKKPGIVVDDTGFYGKTRLGPFPRCGEGYLTSLGLLFQRRSDNISKPSGHVHQPSGLIPP